MLAAKQFAAIALLAVQIAAVFDGARNEEYLWAFSTRDGVPGPRMQVAISNQGKPWWPQYETAITHADRGKFDQAVDAFKLLLDSYRLPDAEAADVHLSLGHVLVNMSLLYEAEKNFEAAVALRPESDQAHFWLGVVYTKQGQFQKAQEQYERALFYDSSFFPSIHNLGSIHMIQGRMDEGMHYFRSALDSMPSDRREAVRAAAADVSLNAILPRLVNHIMHCFSDRRSGYEEIDIATTTSLYMKHQQSLDLALLHLNLGYSLQNVGVDALGLRHLERTLRMAPSESWISLYLALAVPVVFNSADEIARTLTRMHQEASEMLQDDPFLTRPERMRELYHTTYMLPYMGNDDGSIMGIVAQLWGASQPPVFVSAPQLELRYGTAQQYLAERAGSENGPGSRTGKTSPRLRLRSHSSGVPGEPVKAWGPTIRVGLLSYQLHDVPVGNAVYRLVRYLKQYVGSAAEQATRDSELHVSSFHVTLFMLRPYGDDVTRLTLGLVDERVNLPSHRNLAATRDIIAAKKIDVLLVTDGGIDPFVYTLIFSRLAPVQFAYWGSGGGHAQSLGLPDTVDYYVTGEVSSRALAERPQVLHEQALLVPGLAMFFRRPPIPTEPDRYAAVTTHGLFEGRRLYLLPRLLLSLHPDMDDVIAGILLADPVAEIAVLYEPAQEMFSQPHMPPHQLWLEKTRARLRNHPKMTDPAVHRRVRFIRQLAQAEFFALLTLADIVLDSFPVGMGVSALESMALGKIVITLPSKQGWRRIAGPVLQELGMGDLIAQSPDDMVAKAVFYATHEVERQVIGSRLATRVQVFDWDLMRPDQPTADSSIGYLDDMVAEDMAFVRQYRNRTGYASPDSEFGAALVNAFIRSGIEYASARELNEVDTVPLDEATAQMFDQVLGGQPTPQGKRGRRRRRKRRGKASAG